MLELLSGERFDRHSLAGAFGMTVAAADRYIRELARLPGIHTAKRGRRLVIWAETMLQAARMQ